MPYYIGIDVGTTSARAAIIKVDTDKYAQVLDSAVTPITIWNESPDHFEQSSDNIWQAVISCVTQVMQKSKLAPSQIEGVGFDATCSLVVLDKQEQPLSVSPTKAGTPGDNDRNIIMWMDHRSMTETEEINNTNHRLLNFVGGKISVEMEMPKIMWIKKNLPATWLKIGSFFDLPDYLTFKATGSKSRSLCSLVCKWAYDASSGSLTDHSWCDEFLSLIGLQELTENQYDVLGSKVNAPGQPVGGGLSNKSATELRLLPGTPVGTSLIDAHAGSVGMLICQPQGLPSGIEIENKLGLICGTSTCHMISSSEPAYIPGVWGPYFSAIVPGLWCSEGGQSATGKLIDHIIETHPAYSLLDSTNKYPKLSEIITQLAKERNVPEYELTRELHVYPDFHGNRSPLANPAMKGMICGLTLNSGLTDLALLYLATLQSLVYGTRHIVEQMEGKGHSISAVYVCGGLTKNKLFIQMTADILSRPVVISHEAESVLLGSALLGMCAAMSPEGTKLGDIIQSVRSDGDIYTPNTESLKYHEKKYIVYKRMCQDQLHYVKIMSY